MDNDIVEQELAVTTESRELAIFVHILSSI